MALKSLEFWRVKCNCVDLAAGHYSSTSKLYRLQRAGLISTRYLACNGNNLQKPELDDMGRTLIRSSPHYYPPAIFSMYFYFFSHEFTNVSVQRADQVL